MKPILYPSSATSFNNRGLGALSDAISCVVSEERNGEYELTMEYPVGGIHFDEIEDRAIICAIPSPYRAPQPFRIYSIESPLNGVVTIHAHHLSYDLSGIPVSPFTAGSCSQALSGLVTNSVVTNPFTTWTDKSVIGEYKLSVPTSFRACLGGQEGSILDVYGKGEYEFDKYSVKLHLNRGSDNGVKIAYGKNLIDFNMERNLETIVTGILPYWANIDEDDVVEGDIITIYDINNPAYLIDSGGAYLLDSDGKYLLVQNPFPFDNVLPLDLSSDFEEKPTKAQLKEKTEKYIRDNGLGVPRVSIDVSFVQLEQTEEYKDLANLEACDLCDTVTVEFPMYGISAKAKIIRVETDVLLERYISVQIGDTRPTLADSLAHLEINSVTKTEMKAGSQKAADVINNTKGTFEWIDSDNDGENEGFTIYESEGVAFLRCTAGGIGLSQDGGLTYTNAITKNGVIASVLNIIDDNMTMMNVSKMSNGYPRLRMNATNGNPILDVYEWSTETGSDDEGVAFKMMNPERNQEIVSMGTAYDGDTGKMVSTYINIDAPDESDENSWGVNLTANNDGESGLWIARGGNVGIRLGYNSGGSYPTFIYSGYLWTPMSVTISGTSYKLLVGSTL